MKRGDIGIGNQIFHAHKYLKSIVYGGLDGIITTFAIVAGVAGAALNANIVLILGFANLIADGISMATGDYLSTKADLEYRNKKAKKKARKNAFITFISFVVFGFIPLFVYVLGIFIEISNTFFISIILTGIALFTLGVFKSQITMKNSFKSGLEMLVIGGLAAGVAYFIGYFIAMLI